MIEEASRRQLWSALQDTLGTDHADTLMTMLPPLPMPDLATREDMAAIRSEIAAVTATLQAEIRGSSDSVRADLRGELHSELKALRGELSELRESQADLKGELKGDIAELRGEFNGLRGEFNGLRGDFAELRGEFNGLRGDLRAEFSRQTLRLGVGLASLIVATTSLTLGLGFSGAFAQAPVTNSAPVSVPAGE